METNGRKQVKMTHLWSQLFFNVIGGGNVSTGTKVADVHFPPGQRRNHNNLLSHRYMPLQIGT
jgi:hypothetical protein